MRRKRGSLTREEIVQTSMNIVINEGLENLTMRHIAKKLKCSVASPYAHFQNQEEIASELVKLGEKKLTSDLRFARAKSEDVFEQLSLLAHTYWDFSTENRELHKLMMNMGGNFYKRTFITQPTSYRLFLNTIYRGMRSGAIKYPKDKYSSIARTMWSWLYGLIVLEMSGVLIMKDGRDFIEEGIDLFIKVLKQSD